MKEYKMAITKFFEQTLGAKLRNSRWSWGATDGFGRVFLRVWVDQIRIIDNQENIQIGGKSARLEAQAGHGQDERISHIQAIIEGAEAFGVLCVARDPATNGPRHIKTFDEHNLLRLGKITEDGELFFAHIESRIPVFEINRTQTIDISLVNDLKKF
ncbi:MAG: hypothetical protein IPH09_03160 [bacterium]|nr:hypothetical protein [bacterium]